MLNQKQISELSFKVRITMTEQNVSVQEANDLNGIEDRKLRRIMELFVNERYSDGVLREDADLRKVRELINDYRSN